MFSWKNWSLLQESIETLEFKYEEIEKGNAEKGTAKQSQEESRLTYEWESEAITLLFGKHLSNNLELFLHSPDLKEGGQGPHAQRSENMSISSLFFLEENMTVIYFPIPVKTPVSFLHNFLFYPSLRKKKLLKNNS